jgi:hypothetical protein
MHDDDHRDTLPAELDVTLAAGPYRFPTTGRRRWAAAVYGVAAAACLALWASAPGGGVLVNDGFLAAAVALAAVAAWHLAAAWPLATSDTDALVAAVRHVGFPVGHASAQLGWRGLRSRPTWRILLYSADEPPAKRGLVLVDGVDGAVVGGFVEDNPEDWSSLGRD